LSVENTVAQAIVSLDCYVIESVEDLVIAARSVQGVTICESVRDLKKRQKREKFESWKSKPLHGQFVNQTEEIGGNDKWLWLKEGTIKRETESLIVAA